jgi:hypothetical protein
MSVGARHDELITIFGSGHPIRVAEPAPLPSSQLAASLAAFLKLAGYLAIPFWTLLSRPG